MADKTWSKEAGWGLAEARFTFKIRNWTTDWQKPVPRSNLVTCIKGPVNLFQLLNIDDGFLHEHKIFCLRWNSFGDFIFLFLSVTFKPRWSGRGSVGKTYCHILLCTHQDLAASESKSWYGELVSKHFTYLHIQQLWRNIIINFVSCFWPLDECKSSSRSLLALFLVSTISWGKYVALQLLNAPLCSPASRWLCLSASQCWVGSIQSVLRGFSLKTANLCSWKRRYDTKVADWTVETQYKAAGSGDILCRFITMNDSFHTVT